MPGPGPGPNLPFSLGPGPGPWASCSVGPGAARAAAAACQWPGHHCDPTEADPAPPPRAWHALRQTCGVALRLIGSESASVANPDAGGRIPAAGSSRPVVPFKLRLPRPQNRARPDGSQA